MGEALLLALAYVLGLAVPAAVVRRDISRLRGEELARAWPDSSVWSAVLAFSALCIPVHFVRTRRSWRGVLLAMFWLVYTLLLLVFLLTDLETFLGIEDHGGRAATGPPAATSPLSSVQ